MDQLIAVPLADDDERIAVFEVDRESGGADLELAAGMHGAMGRARVSLDRALSDVRPALSRVIHSIRELEPTEAEIQFGLKVGAESGVIIAKGATEVNFMVRLTWRGGEGGVDSKA